MRLRCGWRTTSVLVSCCITAKTGSMLPLLANLNLQRQMSGWMTTSRLRAARSWRPTPSAPSPPSRWVGLLEARGIDGFGTGRPAQRACADCVSVTTLNPIACIDQQWGLFPPRADFGAGGTRAGRHGVSSEGVEGVALRAALHERFTEGEAVDETGILVPHTASANTPLCAAWCTRRVRWWASSARSIRGQAAAPSSWQVRAVPAAALVLLWSCCGGGLGLCACCACCRPAHAPALLLLVGLLLAWCIQRCLATS